MLAAVKDALCAPRSAVAPLRCALLDCHCARCSVDFAVGTEKRFLVEQRNGPRVGESVTDRSGGAALASLRGGAFRREDRSGVLLHEFGHRLERRFEVEHLARPAVEEIGDAVEFGL